MKKSTVTVIGVIGIIVIGIVGYFIATYNSLASAENSVDAKWSQVENVMQRRADLIPNLVNSVKGSMKHESEIFSAITEARKEYNQASTPEEKVAADNKIDQSVGTMVSVIKESYPQLASNENVKTLMTQLEGTENRIAVERRNYITEVQSYNQNLVRFPKNFVAKMLGFEKKANFKAEPGAEKVPDVSFE